MSTEVIQSPEAFRARCELARQSGGRVAFVPTMGALHAGHLALVAEARHRVGPQGVVAVSIFVNPTQFGPGEDLARYPRELDADLARCNTANVDVVFAPSPAAMYPDSEQARVCLQALSVPLCGRFRPGHFEGVATVVAKLFALAGPCIAVFGRKDYQQWRVITAMVRDLFFPVDVIGLATVREADGLAMSSRNRYLSGEDRARAVAIPRGLAAAVRAYGEGERDARVLLGHAAALIEAVASSVDYVSIVHPETLGDIPGVLAPEGRALIAVAARLGGTRLIDNVVLGEEPGPVGL